MKKFKKVRTLADIKADPRIRFIEPEIDSIFDSGRGWWGILKPGWQFDNNEQHTIHEETIKDFCDCLNYRTQEWIEDPDLNFIQ